jgi:hypothetical protein
MPRFANGGRIRGAWKLGMLATPPAPCPNCGRLTRAKYHCPWCDKYWDTNELRKREIFKRQIFANYNLRTRKGLRRLGYI